MNQNTTGVNFELIDDNNRSENAAKMIYLEVQSTSI